MAILIILILLVIITASGLILYHLRWTKSLNNKEFDMIKMSTGKSDGGHEVLEEDDEKPYNECYEFPIDKLKLISQLGTGEYGVVYKAVVADGINSNDGGTTVAVKTMLDNSDRNANKVLSSELKILSKIGHHLNIVNFLGAVTEKGPNNKIMIILEYCPHGSIYNFMLQNRNTFQDDLGFQRVLTQKVGYIEVPETKNIIADDSSSYQTSCNEYINVQSKIPKTSDLISWSYQCSRGMEFLVSKKVIHGDLASRNVLLCNGNIVKISDFGLSKSLYSYYQITRDDHLKLPYKWLAIECFTDNIFSTKSDVWSFGIFLWELFSLCQMPYPGFLSSRQLFENLREGYRMEKPDYANDEMYKMMKKCWEEDPSDRPTFQDISVTFENFLHDNMKNVSFKISRKCDLLNC